MRESGAISANLRAFILKQEGSVASCDATLRHGGGEGSRTPVRNGIRQTSTRVAGL